MEKTDLQIQKLYIDGMTCVNCQNRIEKKLRGTKGIGDASVSYETGTATVTYDAAIITLKDINSAVESLGYKVVEKRKYQLTQIAGTLAIIIALYILFRIFSTSSLAAAFPVARTGMGYGMVLVIGLVTSVHCIAMCGGINLSQTLKKGSRGIRNEKLGIRNGHHDLDYDIASGLHPGISNRDLRSPVPDPRSPLFPAILYNSGRLISYTAVGVVVGALGSVITVSGRFQGAILLLAGIFMLIMGINMLGLFPALRRYVPRMPSKLHKGLSSLFTKKSSSSSSIPNSSFLISHSSLLPSPLIIGFLNGFMPCGPLQAMQIYALSTGSPVRGGISMFLFSLGTIPLMFALGAAGGILSGAKGQVFSRRVMYAGAVLVAAMGLAMFTNGWNLAGIDSPLNRVAALVSPASANPGSGAFVPLIQDGVQIVNSTLLPGRYPAIVVQQGIPVRWIINASQGSINGCNYLFIIREYGIEHSFTPGENVIEFLPEKAGRFPYSCWMGMIRSSVTVVAEGEVIAFAPEPDLAPKPAGVDIPTEKIALAQMAEDIQTVEIHLGDDGFEPAIVVVQRQVPVVWKINIEAFDPGNSRIIFSAFFTRIKTVQGENSIQLFPMADFDFSTGDSVFYGYVKVVDDLNQVDMDAVRAEVANHETLMYPDEYYELAAQGQSGHY
jgi:sulfite exporter TauE/SafE/copper chaperone CopZ/plastocyanin domain-containing protein